jgi:tRNA-specific 2-thiouridylase
VLCNTHIKWNSLLRRADMLDCEFIATGHYGIINEREGRRYITRARDRQKDQSYVLWGLSQECLHRTRMPLRRIHQTGGAANGCRARLG